MYKELVLAAILGAGSVTGCAVFRDQSTAGQYVDDTTIGTEVRAKFAADRQVSMMALDVGVLKGEVQLSGFARSKDEKKRAEELARDVRGVKSVRNDIVVRPG